MNPKKSVVAWSNNTVCRDIGHDFHLTLSATYRRCIRPRCSAAQRLVGQEWIDVTTVLPGGHEHPSADRHSHGRKEGHA